MVYVFLAEGFEETEAIVPVDILRRGELEVATVGVTGQVVTSSHGVPVVADVLACEVMPDETCQAVILPGGMPGTLNLEKSEKVKEFINWAEDNSVIMGAICAAPSILGHMGLLENKEATCYMGFEEQLYGANTKKAQVVRDGNIITACGAGAAFEFAFELLTAITGSENESRKNKKAIMIKE